MPLRRLVVVCCALMLAAVAVAVPVGAQGPAPGERIAPGVTAAGLDLSGLTIDEAVARLQATYGERLERGTVTVKAADIVWSLRTRAANATFDELRTAKRALYAGRALAGAPPPAPGAAPVGADVALAVTYSRAAVHRFAARVNRRLYRAPRNSQLRISIRRVRVTHSRRGRDIDERGLAKKIGAALVDPRIGRVIMPKLLFPKARVTAEAMRKSANTVITIQRSTFKLRLFKALKVVKTYGVAVGLPDYPTPGGRFSVISKQVNPVWSVPNSPWTGELAGTTVAGGSAANPLKARWMGITGSVGIHGTSLDYSIGTRASHGCIRMRVPDVIALYERVPVGTPVLID